MKFLRGFLIVLPLPLLVAYINYTVDPAQLYHAFVAEEVAAGIVASRSNVTGMVNHAERQFQRYLIQRLSKIPETIVLGSSRSMQIGEGIFADVKNHGVSGAVLEDYLGIFYEYVKRNQFPKIVVLGLDPWLLNARHGQIRWRALENNVKKLSSILGLKYSYGWGSFEVAQLVNLFSISYFQESLLYWKDGKHYQLPQATSLIEGEDAIRHYDGTWAYDEKYRMKPQEQVEREIAGQTDMESIFLGSFTEIGVEESQKLISFIHYLKSQVQLVFFLPPYHPLLYKRLMEAPISRIITKAEDFFINLADKDGIPVFGSFDPKKCELKPSDFYDGLHPKQKAVEKIFKDRSKL